jgi:transposase
MGYSLDLRKRVVEAVANGESKQSVAKRYNVSRGTVYNWIRRPLLSASKAGPKKPWRLDMLRLESELQETPDAYLDELATRLGVSTATVHYGLKRLTPDGIEVFPKCEGF